ncbi:uncharacterized protein V6R79_004369 [Siganus canaliculatus]
MSETFADILRESCHKGNFIPLGRQLPRTPPLPDVTRRLVFCEEDSVDEQQSPRNQDDDIQNGASEVGAVQTKTEPDDHNSMLKGMKGYQLTQSDLDFIRKMQEEKLVKKLQKDLEEAQKLLKKEAMAAELAFASREKAQAELRKFPSCEELAEWVSVVLKTTSPSAEVADADVKCLLAAVTADGVRRVLDEKRVELARMERMLANKRKKEAKEKEQLQKRISSEQLKIQGLMSQLSELKSELTQQEEAGKTLEEKVDPSEDLQSTKSLVKRHGQDRKKAAGSTEDAANGSKAARSKRPDAKHQDQKHDTAPKAGREKAEKKAARGSQKKESDPQESERDVRGPSSGSQPRTRTEAKTQKAPSRVRQKTTAAAGEEAGEEAAGSGLRRSKRIASRK